MALEIFQYSFSFPCLTNRWIIKTHLQAIKSPTRGGGGTPLLGLYGGVLLDRVWFFGLAVLNRVYNLTCLCPKQGQNLSSVTGYGIASQETLT